MRLLLIAKVNTILPPSKQLGVKKIQANKLKGINSERYVASCCLDQFDSNL